MRASCVVTFVGCGVPLLAQTSWSMGAPWTDLGAVIAMAAPGDIVRLNGREFPPVVLNKGLTVLGPGRIRAASIVASTTVAVPAGQQAHFVEVDFEPFPLFGGTHSVDVTGTATFEQCTFGAGQPSNVIANGTVLLRDCALVDGTPSGGQTPCGGIAVLGGLCSLVDCTILGGDAVFSAGLPTYVVPSTPAVRVQGGALYASHCVIAGGDGYVNAVFGGPAPGSPGVVVTNGSALLTDCAVRGGSSPAPLAGATGLAGNANTQHARTTLAGGLGATTGAVSSGGVVSRQQLPGLRVSARFALGQPTWVTVDVGSAQGPLGVLVGFDPVVATHPLVLGPFLAPAAGLHTLLATVPPPFSTVGGALNVPNQPALVGLGVHVQAFQFDGVTIYASAPAVGVVN
jgi:hypothetical protein